MRPNGINGSLESFPELGDEWQWHFDCHSDLPGEGPCSGDVSNTISPLGFNLSCLASAQDGAFGYFEVVTPLEETKICSFLPEVGQGPAQGGAVNLVRPRTTLARGVHTHLTRGVHMAGGGRRRRRA